jgi:site-specific recombinase XerD
LFTGYRLNHLSRRQLNRLFHQAAEAAGVDKPVRLHSLRHYVPFLTMSCRVTLA